MRASSPGAELFVLPGYTAEADWTGTVPAHEMPQARQL